MPTRLKPGCPEESTVGSGQFGTLWARTHWLNFRMPLSSSGTSAGGNWSPTPAGSRCAQAFSAAWYRELLTSSCCAPGNFALLAPGRGSGKFATPCERTHWAKASSWEFADPPAFDEPPGSVDDGLPLLDDGLPLLDDGPPLHATASRARAAVAMMAVAVRAVRGDARRGRGGAGSG
jgi:hypothetical protein